MRWAACRSASPASPDERRVTRPRCRLALERAHQVRCEAAAIEAPRAAAGLARRPPCTRASPEASPASCIGGGRGVISSGCRCSMHSPRRSLSHRTAARSRKVLLAAAAAAEPADLLVRLDARADGLDAIEAASRLSRDGPNEITREKPLPGWLHLRRCNLNEPVRSAVDRAGGAVVPERRREGRRGDRRDGRPEHDHPVRAGRPFAPCGTGPVGAGGQHYVGHPPRPAGAPARSPAAFMPGCVRKGAFAPCSLPAHGAC